VSITPTIGIGPDRVVLTFSTGAATAAVKVSANVSVGGQSF